MLCPNCRSVQPDGADYCSVCAVNMRAYAPPYGQAQPTCPPPPPPYQAPPQYQAAPNGAVNDHMTLSVISLIANILFFNLIGLVFAVIALISAGKVKSSLMVRDYMTAQSSSSTAKVCGIIGLVCFGLVLLFWIVYFLFVVAVMGASMGM